MSGLWAPALVALAAWWGGTGLALLAVAWLNRRPANAWDRAARAAVALAGLALPLWAMARAAGDPSPAGAYLGFAAGLGLWGWHEVAFLTGRLAGPSFEPKPPGCQGFERFARALAVVWHHELALALTLLALVAWHHPGLHAVANPTAAWTFAALWALRLSAKLNLFFGVPHFADEFLPPKLAHLRSHFQRAPLGPFYPLSLALGGLLAGWCGHAAWGAYAAGDAFGATAFGLVAALAALGLLEHGFMALPFRDAALWKRAR